ncbi:MAG: cation transporter [Clostridia bacterium]|jgi:copper chaperone CopZ|nr:cation transporter [Clostridia bacterium]MBQ7728583.1 cation transporter [Clostridia bacterium]
MKKVFKIEVDCAVCAQKCEEAISKVSGIASCQVNFMSQKMTLEGEDINQRLIKEVLKAARKVEPDFEIID